MNSNYNKPTKSTSFDFDLNLGSTKNKSLNDQRTSKTPSYTPQSYPNTTPSWQPRPSYTHQPAPTLPTRPGLPTGSPSMVGDIFGKTWGTTNSSIGLVNKNPNLFGDLVGSALGQNSKNTQNVPLKSAASVSKGAFSMGGMADSIPKTGNFGNNMGNNVKDTNLGGSSNFGNFSSSTNVGNNSMKSTNLGGSSNFGNFSSGINVGNNMKNTNLGGSSMGTGSGQDPFASLTGFGSKPAGIGNGKKPGSQNDPFGAFQDAPNFAKPTNQNPPPVESPNLESFFPSSAPSKGSEFVGGDDWGVDTGGDGGGTTELEGLPPPPAGVSADIAKNKGMDNYKQGQYADAIKWLSWAVILLEKAGDDVARMEVLSSRASCYKEVGEYKKAVADCTKVLEHDEKSVSALVQRAMLYESMEKYRLGADDLRTVMKLDPTNRVARSTIHRLNKMAG